MSSITIGDLTLAAEEEHLTFTLTNSKGNQSTQLSYRDAATIQRFLANSGDKESRTGFRVPVEQVVADLPSQLQLTLLYKGTIYDAVPVDLSLTGMLVHCTGIAAKLRSKLVVRVILDDFLAKVEAEVVRVQGDLLALHFAGVMRDGELNPPLSLGSIFARLEQVYLRNRGR